MPNPGTIHYKNGESVDALHVDRRENYVLYMVEIDGTIFTKSPPYGVLENVVTRVGDADECALYKEVDAGAH